MIEPPAPTQRRDALRRRLAHELADERLAKEIVSSLDGASVEALTGGDVAATPLLSYHAATVPDAEIGSLWVLAFGYRFAEGAEHASGDTVPPRSGLLPGPVNEDLARHVADFVAATPVPVIAQWEVADVLQALSVPDVIPVDPEAADDGTVTYLSTAGVIEKGRRLAAHAGITVGTAGVLGHVDHVNRCLFTAQAAGMTAAVPESVALPSRYDPQSGQPWTRSRSAYIPVDLLARARLPSAG